MPRVTTSNPQTISYPAPGSRPYRHEEVAVDPHVVVLFGATGDLARRKLIPGLAYLDQSELAPNIEIVATSLEDLTTDEFLKLAKEAIDNFGTHKSTRNSGLASPKWSHMCRRARAPKRWPPPSPRPRRSSVREVRRLHYLSVPPKAARSVIATLRDANLVDRSRVVMEKPFGTDLATAVALNDFVHETFREEQIFRIDHFLGKEAAQNILAFRFANGLFEPIWNRNFIDHIQIDIPEELGLDERANFYENTGAYKDMVVTHLFQVMAFVVMEPPTALEPRAISEEKNKVFRSLLPVDPANVVRGQFTGYRKTEGVARDSDTETFIALKVGIDNWRWAGVPIYLRTGKRMAEGIRIISIAFREAPRTMFPPGSGVGSQGPDHLTFDLADDVEGVAVVLRQATRPRHEARQAVDAVLDAGGRLRQRCAGGLRTADPGRDARRPHVVHHRRGHRVAMGAIGRPTGRPAARQVVPARDVGTQCDSSADRTERVAAAVRAGVARGQEQQLLVLLQTFPQCRSGKRVRHPRHCRSGTSSSVTSLSSPAYPWPAASNRCSRIRTSPTAYAGLEQLLDGIDAMVRRKVLGSWRRRLVDPVQPPIRLAVTVVGNLQFQCRNVGAGLVQRRIAQVQRVGDAAAGRRARSSRYLIPYPAGSLSKFGEVRIRRHAQTSWACAMRRPRQSHTRCR